jgi:hypothetical protein
MENNVKESQLVCFCGRKTIFLFKIKFLVFLNRFDVSISKINFKIYKKYYFNIFSSKEHFKNTIDMQYQNHYQGIKRAMYVTTN